MQGTSRPEVAMVRSNVLRFALAVVAVNCFAASPDELTRAIRSNDLRALKQLATAASVNQTGHRLATPLHYAAVIGSTESIKVLLAAGANVNARDNMEATPLILAAWSPERIRMLLAAGADPNARTKSGRTALMVAAGRSGSAAGVKLLLDAGADANAADEQNVTALIAASESGDDETIRMLLAKGADVRTSTKAGNTALHDAVTSNSVARVRLYLSKGADPNAANSFAGKVRHGEIALMKLTPLILASTHGSPEMVKALLAAGANPNAQDGRGLSPLMAAVSSENQDPGVIQALLAAGADPNAKDTYGDSALDWARKAGYTNTIRLLVAAGAKAREDAKAAVVPARTSMVSPRQAVDKSVDLLHRTSKEFFKQSGCVACHHQSIGSRALQTAAKAGVVLPADFKADQLASFTISRPFEPMLLQFIDPGGAVDTVAQTLLGFGSAGVPASPLTDAAVNYLAGKQTSDGSWIFFGISRPPIEESNISRTSMAVRAIRQYQWPARETEFDRQIARARAWLLRAEPRTSYEMAELLLGLHWSGASPKDLDRAAKRLLAAQRSDGGWAQNRHLDSDAYATGLALHALHETGRIEATDPRYRRGVDLLLRTQLDDGSWYVKSRAPKFQPYFQSGFPHDHDQWISAAATAYATMAIAPAMTPAPVVARRR
jgi:ankyrin repeat protein